VIHFNLIGNDFAAALFSLADPSSSFFPTSLPQERQRTQLASDEALARLLENETSPVPRPKKSGAARRRAATPDEELAMKIYEDEVGFDCNYLLPWAKQRIEDIVSLSFFLLLSAPDPGGRSCKRGGGSTTA